MSIKHMFSLPIQLFVQKLIQDNNKETIEVLHHRPFVWGIHQLPMDSQHKEPVMHKSVSK